MISDLFPFPETPTDLTPPLTSSPPELYAVDETYATKALPSYSRVTSKPHTNNVYTTNHMASSATPPGGDPFGGRGRPHHPGHPERDGDRPGPRPSEYSTHTRPFGSFPHHTVQRSRLGGKRLKVHKTVEATAEVRGGARFRSRNNFQTEGLRPWDLLPDLGPRVRGF